MKKIIIGLTGSIGMGKSTVSKMFEKCGATIFDADKCVKDLLLNNKKVIDFFKKHYPESFFHNKISTKRLGGIVFSSSKTRKRIEDFLHPFVEKEAKKAIKKAKTEIIILEIPLLFESGFNYFCDKTICVSASAKKQKERFIKRKRMDEKQYKTILKRQYSDKVKRNLSDIIIDTNVTKKETKKSVEKLYMELTKNA